MKEVRTEDAVGLTLVHDITRIIKDEVKDTPFRKGHVIKKEDVDALLKLGKDHVYVFSSEDGNLVPRLNVAVVAVQQVKLAQRVPVNLQAGDDRVVEIGHPYVLVLIDVAVAYPVALQPAG